MKHVGRLSSALALLLSVVACESSTLTSGPRPTPTAQLNRSAANDRVGVCHLDDNGDFIKITVNSSSVAAHREHGDQVIGEGISENCEPFSVRLVVEAPASMTGEATPSQGPRPETDGRLTCDVPVTLSAEGNTHARIVEQVFTLYREDGGVEWASQPQPWPYAGNGNEVISPEEGKNTYFMVYFTDNWSAGWTPFVIDHTFTYEIGDTGEYRTASFRTACEYDPGAS